MKYLLTFKGFDKFKKEWEVIGDYDTIKVRRGNGLIESDAMHLINQQYNGFVKELRNRWFSYKVVKVPFKLRVLPKVADLCPPAALPEKFHNLHQYVITYNGVDQDAVIVTPEEFHELKKIKMIETNSIFCC
jgi:hypothetical protein